MFDGFKVINDDYIYLFLDNNYEFASDINTNRKKERKILDECKYYLYKHNLNFNNRLYFIYNGKAIGYINKYNF